MSPKGGIKPHNKFSVPSNRAEVLFVDYIINHLRPKGRAGIIVPEGIIFQSGNAYKALRKNLVENGLYAVVSLPGGVFQPYSGVKTSILLFDNELAKQKSEIAFIKISADGYDLGATKREVSQNDLPSALESLKAWAAGKSINNEIFALVSKAQIAEKGDYNLSGDRYKTGIDNSNSIWPLVALGEICDVYQPKTITGEEISKSGRYKVYGANGVIGFYDKFNHEEPEVAITCRGATCGTVNFTEPECWITGNAMVVKPKSPELNKRFLFHLLCQTDFNSVISGSAQPQITGASLKPFEIPLPSLEVQELIVAELDGYAAIISGAKQIVENWKPLIDVDPEWPVVELGSCCQFINGDRSENYPTIRTQDISGIPFINAGNLAQGSISLEDADSITEQQFAKISGGKIEINDVLFCLRGSLGKMALNTNISRGAIASSLIILRAIKQKIEPKFLYTLLASSIGQSQITGYQTGAAQPNLAAGNLKKFQVPLPPIKLQQELIREIDASSKNLASVKSLVESYEARTQAVIAKLWNE
jgi:type I restriction enzyme M protein